MDQSAKSSGEKERIAPAKSEIANTLRQDAVSISAENGCINRKQGAMR